MIRARHLSYTLVALACAAPRPPAPSPPGPVAAPAPAPAPEPVPPAPAPTPPPPPPAFAPVAPVGPDEWWNGAVFYEVFVRSFADSDGDGVGDLRGLTAHLDELNDGDPATRDDLGVDALWLMPIFRSPSYHGYDVTDFDRVQPAYGTEDDLRVLLEAAHRRGMKVLLDLPLNHTSDQHPWFQDSASGPSSARRGWYEWSAKNPGWGKPWDFASKSWHPRNGAFYYGLFWSGMPDLDYRNPAVREEMERVVRSWLARGVDGFRLDAVRFLVETGPLRGQVSTPETHAVLKQLAAAARREAPQAALVGEVWSITEDIADYYGNGRDELQLAFDFPLAAAIVAAARSGQTEELTRVLSAVARAYPPGAVDAPFLTNHDQVRLATQLGRDPEKLRLAAALLLTLPGSPFLWQGEELGQENGGGPDDEEKRTPLPWTCQPPGHGFTAGTPWRPFAPGAERACVAAERADPGSLRSFYRDLIAARRSSPALSRGGLTVLPVPAAPRSSLAFLRRAGTEAVLVVVNAGGEGLEAGPLPAAGSEAEPLLPGPARLTRRGEAWWATLPARSSGVWRLR